MAADVTITIDANDQSQAAFDQIFQDLRKLEDRIEALADAEVKAARESERETEKSEREKTAARERANRDQITFIRNLRRQEIREAAAAAQATAKATREAQAEERAVLADRKREFSRILRESTIVSEQAAREIANDFSDIEGSLKKAIDAYRRGQREAEKFYKEQEQAATDTFKVTTQSRLAFTDLFHAVSNGIFIFQELRYAVGNVVRGIIDVTAKTQTMQATLRVTETDVKGVSEELLELNRTLLGIEVDTLLSGFTRFRVAGASIEDTKIALSAVAKGVSELGKSTEVTDRVIEQLTQSYAQNVADSQDLKTLFRELPQLMEAATTALGHQVQGWRDFGTAAETAGVDVREAWRLTLQELNRTSLGGDRNTFAAQSEIFRENVNDLRRAIGQELVPAITQAINAMNEWLRNGGIERISGGFQTLSRNVVPATLAIGSFFGIRGLRGGIPQIRSTINNLRDLQGTFGQYDSGISSAVFNTQRWRDTLVIAQRNAADANAQVQRSISLYGAADRNLVATAKSANDFNDRMQSLNTRFRAFGSIVKSTLIDAGIAAAVGLIVAAWQDHNRQVRAAEKLIEEVTESYSNSLRSILTAVKDLNNIRLENVSRELERVLRSIADARQRLLDVNAPGLFSTLNPFDNDAIASQRASLEKIIENAELQERFLRALADGGSDNAEALSQVRADVQAELDALNSTLEQFRAFSNRLPEFERSNASRLPTRYLRDAVASLISDTEADIQTYENLIERFNQVSQRAPFLPTQDIVSLIDIDKARANLEDAQLSLNEALDAGNIQLTRTLYEGTANSYVALAGLQRSYAKQTITDADALNRELYKINRDLFTNTRDLFTSTQENITKTTTATKAGLKQIQSDIDGLRTGFKSSVDSIHTQGNRLVNVFTQVRDALKPIAEGALETPALARAFGESQTIGPVGDQYLRNANAYVDALTTIADQEKAIQLFRESLDPAVDPLREIGRGPDVPDGREAAEAERQLAFETNQFIFGLVRERFAKEAQATRAHVDQTFQYYRQGASLVSNLAFSLAFDRERSFQETAAAFVKQSLVIVAQSIIEHQIRMAQLRRETAELERVAAARNAAYGQVFSPGGSQALSSLLSFVPGGNLVAPIVNNLIQIGANDAREIGEYQQSLQTQKRY